MLSQFRSPFALRMIVAAVASLASACASTRDAPAASSQPPSNGPVMATAEKAAEIATQPARDLGVTKPEIPAILAEATVDPYSLSSTATCKELGAAIRALNEHLGPDYLLATEKDENRVAKIAEAGGKTIVNSIIPFRGLVRELTGAAAAQRRFADAIDAGYARRGFLRGIQLTRACPATP